MKKAYLTLSDGHDFEGVRFGAEGTALGELVFTTGVCGYMETLSDPSYCGQLIMQTFPLIGNYGMIEEDMEGVPAAGAYIVRSWCDHPSNFRSGGTIDEFLKKHNIPGLSGIETREVTRILREKGVMNAVISDEPVTDLAQIAAYRVENAVARVSHRQTLICPPEGDTKYKVTLIDYGEKRNIIRNLNKRGCLVTVVPHDTSAEAILASAPDGVMLSNGPGDPADNAYEIAQIKALIGKLPLFGICLGHQMLALAMGGETVKLKYGHRGANQPVRRADGLRTYITSQNHGYAAVAKSLEGIAVESFVNANDLTNEGLTYPGCRAFSAQFHPEACAGPLDTGFLFDRFTAMMGGDETCR